MVIVFCIIIIVREGVMMGILKEKKANKDEAEGSFLLTCLICGIATQILEIKIVVVMCCLFMAVTSNLIFLVLSDSK